MTLVESVDDRFSESLAQDDLPQGWSWSTVEAIRAPNGPIVYGILKPGPHVPNGIPYVRPTEIVGDEIQVGELRRTSAEIAEQYRRAALKAGDILLTIVGSIGKVATVPRQLDGANITQCSARIRLDPTSFDSTYFRHALKSPHLRAQMEDMRFGSGVTRLNIAHVRDLRIPVAPLAEQKRIAAKVEALLGRVRAASGRLAKVPALLKRFRQSILAAACSGRLTADWRDHHDVVEPAGVLLARLVEGRRRLMERKQRKRKYVAPPDPIVPEGMDLPNDWCWASVAQLSRLDVGFAFRSTEYAETGIRLLRGENLEPGSLRWSDVRYWPREKLDEFRDLIVEEGEIILAMDRPVISSGLKIARAKSTDLPCLLVQRMTRFKMVDPGMTGYLFACLQTERFINSLTHGMTGSDLPHITGTGLAEFAIPLPPLAEQHEIVRRVESLFALADAAERRVAAAAGRAGRITQAVLARAFRGELVETEAALARREGRDYEPASVLLERIRAERDKAAANGGGRMPRRRKQAARTPA